MCFMYKNNDIGQFNFMSSAPSTNCSTTIRTNRYYIRILCWVLDRVLHTLFVIVCYCTTADIGNRGSCS